jgi:peptidoglycan-associated lipoprotein
MFGKKKTDDPYGGEVFQPQPLEGDYALGARFEDTLTRRDDLQFDRVYFGYDSFRIDPVEIVKIEAVAEYMRRVPQVKLVAEGHCDERGSREYNMSLGEHRALAVRAHLIGAGVDGNRVQTRSYGEEMPVDPGHHEGAWRLNRRVEFVFYE